MQYPGIRGWGERERGRDQERGNRGPDSENLPKDAGGGEPRACRGSVALAMKGALLDGFIRSDGKDGVGHRRCSRKGSGESTALTRLGPPLNAATRCAPFWASRWTMTTATRPVSPKSSRGRYSVFSTRN